MANCDTDVLREKRGVTVTRLRTRVVSDFSFFALIGCIRVNLLGYLPNVLQASAQVSLTHLEMHEMKSLWRNWHLFTYLLRYSSKEAVEVFLFSIAFSTAEELPWKPPVCILYE